MNLFFYTLIKMIIHHLLKMTQIRNNKHNNKKIFMTITLNFDIVVNKNYLYNYSEKLQYN